MRKTVFKKLGVFASLRDYCIFPPRTPGGRYNQETGGRRDAARTRRRGRLTLQFYLALLSELLMSTSDFPKSLGFSPG
jgi:hypothetical protein